MKVRCFKMWTWLQTLRQGKWLNKKLSWAPSTASPLTPPSVSTCNLNLSLDRRKGRLAPPSSCQPPPFVGIPWLESVISQTGLSLFRVTLWGYPSPIPVQFTCFWVKSSRKLLFPTHCPPHEPSSMEAPPCTLVPLRFRRLLGRRGVLVFDQESHYGLWGGLWSLRISTCFKKSWRFPLAWRPLEPVSLSDSLPWLFHSLLQQSHSIWGFLSLPKTVTLRWASQQLIKWMSSWETFSILVSNLFSLHPVLVCSFFLNKDSFPLCY